MTIEHFRYPTREEINALVHAARRDRAEAIASLCGDAVSRLAELIARGLPVEVGARARRRAEPSRISSVMERPMAESFWKIAAASLPPQIRWRYGGLFEAAERYELLFDFLVTSGGHARSALARTCRWLADALRDGARRLDFAARRLTVTR
jgi:hypothetical protein